MEDLAIQVARGLVLLAFLGIAGWTVRSLVSIWVPVLRGAKSALK